MAEQNDTIGRTLSRYRILEEVGRGGMATVYRALDPALGREVAVKVLHPHLAGERESRNRFEREAQAVAKLRHDNILEIHDFSAAESSDSFLVTEFIRGPTLTAFLDGHAIVVPDVAAMIGHELAAALANAHASGVIHRDIKPENVMIRLDDGRIKLTDFGIAQVIDKERLTATGQLIGSPAYLAPELVEGGRVDFRTDVFSLGIVIYRTATGQLPFQGRNPHEMMKRIVEGRCAPPDQVCPAMGRGLARIILRALARRPDDRYPTMEALRRDLAADLLAGGIEEPRAELKRFFADPAGWETAARPRIAAALVESARRERARGKRAAALSLVTRAVALAPGDGAAKALLDRIERTRRYGSAALIAGGAVAAIAGGALVLRPLVAPRVVASGARPSERVEPPSTLRSPPTPTPPPSPIRAPAPVSPGAGAAPRPAPPRWRWITVAGVVPMNAYYFVDGVRVGSFDPIERRIRVPSGRRHTVHFEHDACYASTPIVVGSDTEALPSVRLRFKEARLIFETDPKGADVLFHHEGTRRTGIGGETLTIGFPEHATEGHTTVRYSVSKPGFRTTSEKAIRIEAARTTTVPVALEPRR